MARLDLYTLAYTRRNVSRLVYYENEGGVRKTDFEDSPLNPDEEMLSVGQAAPDSWPYADQALVTTVTEGAFSVKLFALRVSPFARFEPTQIAGVCDIQLSNFFAYYDFNTALSNIGFAISTSNPPFETSLDGGPYTRDQTTYLNLPLGAHTLDARDALTGCKIPTYSFTLSVPPPDDPETTPYALPAGAIVLRIRNKQVLNDDRTTTNEYTTYYYLPSTRAVGSLFTGTGAEDRSFRLDQTLVIDRWCLEPGVAPFTEIQVRHDGEGGVTRTNVDGVTSCMIVCTLGLTATGVMAGGVGTITATSTGAQGRVLMSLDNFLTEGVEEVAGEVVFDELTEGPYLVTARDSKGCLATARVTLQSLYGPRYQLDYDTTSAVPQSLLLYERDYTGEVEMICGGGSPVEISTPGSSTDHVFSQLIKGSVLDMTLLVEYERQFLPVFSGDERLYRVEHERNGVLDWRGYLLPEQYSVLFLAPPVYFSLSATDGIGTLSTIPFLTANGSLPVGDYLLLDLVQLCLSKLGLYLPLRVLCNLYPEGADRTLCFLETVRVDASVYQDKGKAWDCGKVLRAVCQTPLIRFYQEDGALWLERLADLTAGEMSYFAYDETGEVAPLVRATKLRTILPESELHWLLGTQTQSIRGAVAAVEIESAVGEVVNQFAQLLPAPAATQLPNWSGQAPYQLIYQGKDKTPLIRLTGAAPGVPLNATQYVQTPPTQPFPIPLNSSASLRVTIKAQAYGQVVVDPALPLAQREAQTAYMGFGLRWGSEFHGESPTFYALGFPTNAAVEFSFSVPGPWDNIGGPVVVRLSQSTAGAATSPVTVDVSELSLRWEYNDPAVADSHPARYTFDTKLRVSRRDDQDSLFHLDTPLARRAGTFLSAARQPTARWQQEAGGVAVEAGVFHVLNRVGWQDEPAQTLSGTVLGALSPGALLTDPDEARPCVYLLTDYRRLAKEDQHTLSAVQLLPLAPPNQPAFAMLYEDRTPILAEAGDYLQFERPRNA